MKHEHYILCGDGRKREAVLSNCLYCKKEFLYRKRKRYVVKFCSTECRYKDCRVELECSLCKKKFLKKKSGLSNSKHETYFCSRKCKDLGQRLESGITDIHPYHYGNGHCNYRNLISSAINPKCCDCSESREYLLCVHHVDADHKNDDKTNLEIVCFNCHARRHLFIGDNKVVYRTKALTPRNLLNSI